MDCLRLEPGTSRTMLGKKNLQGTRLQPCLVCIACPNEFYAGVLTKLVRPCFPVLGSKTHFFKGGATLKAGSSNEPCDLEKRKH